MFSCCNSTCSPESSCTNKLQTLVLDREICNKKTQDTGSNLTKHCLHARTNREAWAPLWNARNSIRTSRIDKGFKPLPHGDRTKQIREAEPQKIENLSPISEFPANPSEAWFGGETTNQRVLSADFLKNCYGIATNWQELPN
jgi:hypothetical protein